MRVVGREGCAGGVYLRLCFDVVGVRVAIRLVPPTWGLRRMFHKWGAVFSLYGVISSTPCAGVRRVRGRHRGRNRGGVWHRNFGASSIDQDLFPGRGK